MSTEEGRGVPEEAKQFVAPERNVLEKMEGIDRKDEGLPPLTDEEISERRRQRQQSHKDIPGYKKTE